MFYIAIVSHNHSELIKDLGVVEMLSELDDVCVVIKDNANDSNLDEYCKDKYITYLSTKKTMGFGENNNYIFNYCVKNFNVKNSDFFILINPDVVIDLHNIIKLTGYLKKCAPSICTLKMYSDLESKNLEHSIHKFPSFFTFILSFLGYVKNYTYSDDERNDIKYVNWSSGAFLCFKFDVYKKLKGFDERYFMYCEDLDICKRAFDKKIFVEYLNNIKAFHLARRNNRNILSKHFLWHLKSILMYIVRHGVIFNRRSF